MISIVSVHARKRGATRTTQSGQPATGISIHTPQVRSDVKYTNLTTVCLLFESGTSIKEFQARLGHKDVQTTMNIYACVTPQMIENTGEKFAKYIGF